MEEGKLNPLSSIEKKVIKVQNCYRQLVMAAFCILNDFFLFCVFYCSACPTVAMCKLAN